MDERRRMQSDLAVLLDEVEQALQAAPACRNDPAMLEKHRSRFYSTLSGQVAKTCQTFLKEIAHIPAGITPPQAGQMLSFTIPGLDQERGGARSMRREKLYLTLLRKFWQGHQDTMAQLTSCIGRQDWDTAHRQAHSLKGVAATIGAMETSQAAQKLEALLRDVQTMEPQSLACVQPQLDECLLVLDRALSCVLDGLRIHLPPEKPHGDENIMVDGGHVRDLLVQIDQMLKEYDPMVVSVLGCNAALLERILPDSFHQMRRTLEAYDFEAAARHLAQAQAQIEKFIDSKNSV